MPLVFGRSILGFGVVAGPPAPTWTNPDLVNASYDSKSVSVSSLDGFPSGLGFKDDGTKVYFCGLIGIDINEMNLSTAWDISTATGSSTFSVSSQSGSPTDLAFKPDGTKMYYVGQNNASIYEYSLSTAWDITSASYVRSFSVSTQDFYPWGLAFKPDGTEMYVGGDFRDRIYQYTLSTGWNLSTASFTNELFISLQTTSPNGLGISPNGDRIYVASGNNPDSIKEYSLSTAWDITTGSLINSFSVSSQSSSVNGVTFKTDGSKMYIVGGTSLFQYSTPAWTNPNLATASYDSVSASVSTQASNAHSLVFKPDGTTLYLLDDNNNAVYEYDLSTSWDLSTLSYSSSSLSVSSQETSPSQMYFKPDGTKIYIVGFNANSVFQYGLSTAWDLSTASYDSVSFSVSSQTTAANGLAFKPDGTKFFVCDFTGVAGKVYQYSLSTAWDLSTASYVSNSGNLTQEGVAAEIIFNPDGTKLWLGGPLQDKVFQYSLSTAWDITTISYDSVSFSVSSQENNFRGFNFKPDGSKLYAVGWTNNTIYQYST